MSGPGSCASTNPAFETEFPRFGGCNVARPVDIEHARKNDTINRMMLSNQPAEIVAKPDEIERRLRRPLCRQPIEPRRHMSAIVASELPNPTVSGIQRGP